MAFQLDACQFDFPQLAIEDVVSLSVSFIGQEPGDGCGAGGEVSIFATK